MTQKKLLDLATNISQLHKPSQFMLATAESCTGGQIAYLLTSIPGSSNWFDRGFVTYSNAAKHENLGVSLECLAQFGAVSEQTAVAMAEGTLKHSDATISVATTGIAGPGGGSEEKPVGSVWIAWAERGKAAYAKHFLFKGSRQQIRDTTCENALLEIIKLLQKS